MRKSYDNAYRLIMGETTYEKLSTEGYFFLPKNHEDPSVTMKYFEEIEDYERCIKIKNKLKQR